MVNIKHRLATVAVILALSALAATNAWAQGRGPRFAAAGQATQQARDPLAFLKQALSKAGAAALDSTQETALNTLITNFRNANKPAPDPNEQGARDAYAKAILAGKNPTDANSAADNLAGLMAAHQRSMLEAEAGFMIQALSYLSSDQVAALQKSVGDTGILRVLRSMIGPGPGFGRGMMGGRGQSLRGSRS